MEELVGDMVSSLKNHLGWKEGQPPEELEEPGLADVWPCGARPPEGGGGAPLLRETLLRQGKPIKEP